MKKTTMTPELAVAVLKGSDGKNYVFATPDSLKWLWAQTRGKESKS